MRIPIERYAPPGVDVQQEVERTVWGLIAAAVLSLRFLLAYLGSRSELYDVLPNGVRVLEEHAMMPTFRDLFSWSFLGFGIFLLAMAAVAAMHVAYHYQGGSRPIYLMRRLPDRWEYWRRCLAPAGGRGPVRPGRHGHPAGNLPGRLSKLHAGPVSAGPVVLGGVYHAGTQGSQ